MIDKHYAPIRMTPQYPLSFSSQSKPSNVGYGQTLRANPVDSFSPTSLRGVASIQFQGFWSPFSRLYHRLLQKGPSKAKKNQGRAEKDFAREMNAFNTLKIQTKQLDDAISTLNGKRLKQIEGLKSVLKEREQLAFSILAMTGGTVSVTEPEAMVSEVQSKIGKMLGNPEKSFLGLSDPKKGIALLQKFKQLDAHINQARAVIKDYEKALAELQLRSGEMSKKTAYLGYGTPKKSPPVGFDDDYLDELAKDPHIIASIFEDKLGVAAKLAADIDAVHAKKAASDAITLGKDDDDEIIEALSAHSFAWHEKEEPNPFKGDLAKLWQGLFSEIPPSDLFLQLVPDILLNQPLSTLNELSNRIELLMDFKPTARGYHPNEAEMLLLLNHPELWDRNPKKTEDLTEALTSINRFIEPSEVLLSDTAVKAWASIGSLTHSFRFWKWDATGGDKSLLSQFGFQSLPTGRPGDAFGKGFLYKDEISGSTLEFRRGYLLATHPDHGTLVIRNSSPAFGRDLMRHPAYLLPNALTHADILDFNPKDLPETQNILHRDVYLGPEGKQNDADKHLLFLTEAIERVKADYRRFKLDTSAFEGYDEDKHFTGHLSEGLPKVVHLLNELQSKSPEKPMPNLAFVHPHYPIYQPNGVFVMTPAHLKELNQFIQGKLTGDALTQSDWFKFMTQHGVEQRGELVILDPEPVVTHY